MNKIDELKRDIEFHKRGMEISKSLLANAEKDLAALEAQERKPREWSVVLMSDGRMMCSADFQDSFLGYPPPPRTPLSETIKVREVKPIVVTMEMAKSLYETGMNSPSEWDKPMTWVVIFRAAGIAAEPSND